MDFIIFLLQIFSFFRQILYRLIQIFLSVNQNIDKNLKIFLKIDVSVIFGTTGSKINFFARFSQMFQFSFNFGEKIL